MPSYVFPPAPIPAAPIRGRDALFPIHRIFRVGRNYEAHAKEMGAVVDREAPFYFNKSAHAYVASGSTVPYPPGTKDYHHEMELVVAIGKAGLRIAEASALDHVFGYACGLDMTRRDLQRAMGDQKKPWEIGKSFDRSAPIGPLHTVAQTGHFTKGAIWLRVNGQLKQNANLNQMIWSVAEQVSKLSDAFELFPGDIIYSGTPENVGPVVRGNVMEGRIDGLYDIRVRVV